MRSNAYCGNLLAIKFDPSGPRQAPSGPVVPDEVVELACLLEFLEKQLDRRLRNRTRTEGFLILTNSGQRPPR